MDIKPHREALSSATEVASTLTIPKVTANDTGSYSCNVTSTVTTHIQQTQVKVYGESAQSGTAELSLLAKVAHTLMKIHLRLLFLGAPSVRAALRNSGVADIVAI